jgi:hypothetical protein
MHTPLHVPMKWILRIFLFILAWRFFTGNHLNGVPRTDAGWFIRGRELVNRAKYPRPGWWSYQPRVLRALIRLSAMLALFEGTLAWFLHRQGLLVCVALSGAALVVLCTWRLYRVYVEWSFQHHTLSPLALAASPTLDLPPREIEAGMLYRDGWLKLPVPPHWTTGGSDGSKLTELTRLANQRIGGDWKVETQLKRLPFYILLMRRPEPKESFSYEELLPLVMRNRPGNVILGIQADNEITYADVYEMYPMIGLSMGTGAGKSSFFRSFIAQESYWGVDDFDVCDVKMVSIAGMEEVPGLRIHRSPQEIRDAIHDTRTEMERRYQLLLQDPKRKFPRKYLILEEQNAFAILTGIEWAESGGKGIDPVWNDVKLLIVMARQVGIHLIGAYQLLLANVTGNDSTIRTQMSLKILSRFTPQAWDLLVGERPREKTSNIPGRAVAVMEGERRRFQIPFVTVEEAMDLVKRGKAWADAEMMHMRPDPHVTRQQRAMK